MATVEAVDGRLPRRGRGWSVAAAVLLASVLPLAALSTPAAARAAAPVYYLALGDSLAYGYQPIRVVDQGYAADLARTLKDRSPSLELVNLACPGETTASMIAGGRCGATQATSQLHRAVAFLRRERGHTGLVTLDIGANDIDGCLASLQVQAGCVEAGIAQVLRQLPLILAQLRAAAGPSVPIVGMNYYDPFLATYLLGPWDRWVAAETLGVTLGFDAQLDAAYAAGGDPVADVFQAFQSTRSTPVALPVLGTVPTSVAVICRLTWMCAPPPVGPDVHANAQGYLVIAQTFAKALRGVPLP